MKKIYITELHGHTVIHFLKVSPGTQNLREIEWMLNTPACIISEVLDYLLQCSNRLSKRFCNITYLLPLGFKERKRLRKKVTLQEFVNVLYIPLSSLWRRQEESVSLSHKPVIGSSRGPTTQRFSLGNIKIVVKGCG